MSERTIQDLQTDPNGVVEHRKITFSSPEGNKVAHTLPGEISRILSQQPLVEAATPLPRPIFPPLTRDEAINALQQALPKR